MSGNEDEDLFDSAKFVKSRGDFIEIIRELIDDFNKNSSEWENVTIVDFLGGMVNFVEDMDGYYININENLDADNITWRIAADIILSATTYPS